MDSSATHEELLLRQSDILIADGEYEKAISCLDEILKRDPEDEEALSLKGLAYCLKGEPETGIAIFEEALEIDPFSRTVLITFADACLHSSMPEKSLEILERAINYYPDDDSLVMLKKVILGARDRSSVNSYFN